MVADFLEADGWEVLLLGPGAPARDLAALVEHEQPDLVALSTATAGVLNGVVEVLGALAALSPRPCIVAGGQFWTAETSPSALEFGADLVVQDPRELVATCASGSRRGSSDQPSGDGDVQIVRPGLSRSRTDVPSGALLPD